GGEKWARYSFVGFEPEVIVRGIGNRLERSATFQEVEVRHGDPWSLLKEELARFRPPKVDWLPRFWGGAVGYVPYDAVRRFEPKVSSATDEHLEFCFALGGTVLIFDNVRKTLHVVAIVRVDRGIDEGAEAGDSANEKASERAKEEECARAYEQALRRIDRARALLEHPAQLRELRPATGTSVSVPASNFAEDDFVAAVSRAQDYIRAGDIFQVVLSQRFQTPRAGVDPVDLYRAMRVINPSPYMYFLRFGEQTIAGASPETLVRVDGGVAEVRPIAGTRPRGDTADADRAIETELLADPKERAEHVMLVDLGRNDIGRISRPGTVEITEQMAIERYSHVMHIVSNVRGQLAEGKGALDVLRATFPAGTLSGAPKVRAMQIIEELEPTARGVYGGAVGYLGFDGNMDVAIAIRTATIEGDQVILQAGAGIVEGSDPRAEYQETIAKARAGLLALRVAQRTPD
ncbi:MAG: chorismate-binding protein, partial [Myxococcota bacterium]